MTQGELYKKLSPMFDGYFDDRYEFADVLKVLDEAKKDLPKRRSVVLPQPIDLTDKTVLREKHRQEAINEALYLQDIEKWIKKWFGDVTQ
jgi:hypothetical protein